LLVRNPGFGGLLADLEADDDLRAKLEMKLLPGSTRFHPLEIRERSPSIR